MKALRTPDVVAHVTIDGAGHILQEDAGPRVAQVVVDFVQATS